MAERGWRQRLIVRKGHELLDRCADIEGLELVAASSNPLAVGLAIRGSRIAHAHDARTVYSGLFAKLLLGIPFILTRRVVAPQKPSWIRALAYRKAANVAAVSSAVAERVHERYPDINAEIVVDAWAAFESDADEAARIRSRYPGKMLIGNVGALDDSHKGQSTIIEAAHIAAERHPDWQFLICGSGKDEQRYREQIGDLKNIELEGWVDNVGDYLAAFDLFVYPSRHEALGSAILDAMQFGLPVVASNVGGIPDVVRDGENGCLIAPGNAGELVSAVAGILGSPDELTQIRRRNIERAADFSVAKMADAYEIIYRLR